MDPSWQRRLAERLRGLRQQRQMTQEELAERAGFHPTYIQKVEAARICPSLEAVSRLAKALKVPASAIVGALDEPAKGERDRLIADVADLLRGCPEGEVRFVYRFVEFLRRHGLTPDEQAPRPATRTPRS